MGAAQFPQPVDVDYLVAFLASPNLPLNKASNCVATAADLGGQNEGCLVQRQARLTGRVSWPRAAVAA